MGSLSAHLRAPEDHARLPFHPDCPVCRSERLTGVLPPAGVVSLRTQAALAAGVLAFSAAAPAAVLAAEPDQEQQGATAPGQSGGADTAGNPDFDPGGASTDLPSDAPPVPQPRRRPPPATTMPPRSTRSRQTTSTLRWPTRATIPPDRTRSNPTRPRLPLPRPPPATLSSQRRPRVRARPRTRLRQRPLRRARRARTPVCDSGRTSAERTRSGRRRRSSPEPVSWRAPLPPVPPLTPPRARRARPPAFNRSKHGRRPASPWRSGIATLPRGATARTSLARESRCGRSPGTCSAGRRRPPRSRAR